MPRRQRHAVGGYAYHVLNRAVGRRTLFRKAGDYAAFFRVLTEARDWIEVPLLGYGLMPNHWHLVLWPLTGRDLSRFVGWLTLTHTQRWHAHHHTVGSGHLYQGRFKSFPVEADDYFLTLCRYVERNALRAGLVGRAEDWRWSSLALRQHDPQAAAQLLSPWPVPCPEGWLEHVNAPQTEAELRAVRECVKRGRPLGSPEWVQSTAERLHLAQTLRPQGRPRKRKGNAPSC